MELTGVEFSTVAAAAVGSLVLLGQGVIWGFKKAIGMAK
jgi:hypothetical protein